MKYYFVKYIWKYPPPNSSEWHEAQTLITIHPISFQLIGVGDGYECMVQSWQEITKEEYEQFNGEIF
jgi:hypothetical protein